VFALNFDTKTIFILCYRETLEIAVCWEKKETRSVN